MNGIKSARGFSIIETLIAITIFGIIATAIFAFFATISRSNKSARVDQELTIAAKRFMEDVHGAWTDKVAGQSYFDDATFSNGTAIEGYRVSQLPTGLSCQAAITDPTSGAFTPVERRRVNLTCTAPNLSPVVFSIEFGRQE